jgi:hypothetical protein
VFKKQFSRRDLKIISSMIGKGEEFFYQVTVSLSSLSEDQVRIWVDNFRVSLRRKKTGEDKQSEPIDKK